jgi:hypothetical protein
MEERIRFIDHQGKKILLVDFSNCPANEVERIARAVPDYVTVQPRNSVLVLTDFTGASFDRDAYVAPVPVALAPCAQLIGTDTGVNQHILRSCYWSPAISIPLSSGNKLRLKQVPQLSRAVTHVGQPRKVTWPKCAVSQIQVQDCVLRVMNWSARQTRNRVDSSVL